MAPRYKIAGPCHSSPIHPPVTTQRGWSYYIQNVGEL